MLKPVDPALFLSEDAARPPKDESLGIDLVPACPSSPPHGTILSDCSPRVQRPCVQRPNATTPDRLWRPRFRTRSGSSFCVPGRPEIRGRQALLRCRSRASGVSLQEPLWERPAGPKHTRAEQVE